MRAKPRSRPPCKARTQDARDFVATLDQLADSLAELLKPDTTATLIELAEYAIEQTEASLEQVDDSDGELGDVVVRLGEFHLQACLMARPNPVALAERLFELTFTLAFGLWSFDPPCSSNWPASSKRHARTMPSASTAAWCHPSSTEPTTPPTRKAPC